MCTAVVVVPALFSTSLRVIATPPPGSIGLDLIFPQPEGVHTSLSHLPEKKKKALSTRLVTFNQSAVTP